MTKAIENADDARRWFRERGEPAPVFDPDPPSALAPCVFTAAFEDAEDEALGDRLSAFLVRLQAAGLSPVLEEAWLASEFARAFTSGPVLEPAIRCAFLQGWRHALLLGRARARRGAELAAALERARREARQEIEGSDAWRLLTYVQDRRDRWFPPRSRRLKALRWMVRGALRDSAASAAEDGDAIAALERSAARPRLLIVSGAGGASRRYRCLHLLEALIASGGDGRCLDHRDPKLGEAPSWMGRVFDAVLLQRVGLSPGLEALIAAARERACPVVFEADDLVFDAARLPDKDHGAARLVRGDDARRIAAVAAACDSAITSTEPLAEALSGLIRGPVRVLRNAASAEMRQLSDRARSQRAEAAQGPPVIGYASGTPTHDRDLASIAPALAEALARHPEARCCLIGPVATPRALAAFEDRIERRAFVPWRSLPEELARFAINLAPFERGAPFVEAKSEVKFIEAALVGVPTIASPIPAFRAAITDGACGRLAEGGEAWSAALDELLQDAALRAAMGQRACERARAAYEVEGRAEEVQRALTGSAPRPRIKP